MSSDSIRTHAVDLTWSLWTELGVPGVVRNHRNVIIDPEPLIVATPTIAVDEPRLMEQAFGWCVAHADRISASRLGGLLRESDSTVRFRFGGFSEALRTRGVKWPAPASELSGSPPSSVSSPPLPLDRPSMLRLRLRALSGVGARADVLCELIANRRNWLSAAQLARTGYTKRNVARVLSEMSAAGIVQSRREANSLRYRLRDAESIVGLVGGNDLAVADWYTLMQIVLDLLGLLNFRDQPATVRRVEANRLGSHLEDLALRVGLETPPPTRGVADAWELILTWGTDQLQEIAEGAGPAFPAPG